MFAEFHFHRVEIDGEPPPPLPPASMVILDELRLELARGFLPNDDIKSEPFLRHDERNSRLLNLVQTFGIDAAPVEVGTIDLDFSTLCLSEVVKTSERGELCSVNLGSCGPVPGLAGELLEVYPHSRETFRRGLIFAGAC